MGKRQMLNHGNNKDFKIWLKFSGGLPLELRLKIRESMKVELGFKIRKNLGNLKLDLKVRQDT